MSFTNINENKGIFSQAREYIHQTVQSDKDPETIKEGEKSSVTRALEQVNISSEENEKSEDNKKGFISGAVESTRKSIYNATKSGNERELEDKAQMTIAEKATAEVQEMASKVDDGLHSVLLPVEGKDYEAWKAGKSSGKDHVEAAVEKAEKKVGHVQDKAQDKVEAAVNTAQEKTNQVVAEAKETGSEVLRQGQEIADKVDDGLHYAVLPVEGKDYDAWKQKKIEFAPY